MELDNRIDLFAALGHRMNRISSSEMTQLCARTYNENNWFTAESIARSFKGIGQFLSKDSLGEWVSHYSFNRKTSKSIGVVMAGNIPLVGFHDLLSILISGNKLAAKTSSSDSVLMKWIIDELIELEPDLKSYISIAERLNDVDAIIATGSNNSARYFEYYFSKKPNIIRKNRSSCAFLSGEESYDQLVSLGSDVFSYYGLGCRNVSKIYVPNDYDLPALLDHFSSYDDVSEHHKYHNNYDYNKSIYLVNREPHLDTGFLLLKQSQELISPISVLYYEFYLNADELSQMLKANKEKIQCVVGQEPICNVAFGQTQVPVLSDYADGVDTLQFLASL